MRRKHKALLAAAVAAYLFVLGYAYHWGATQRFPDGSIYDHIENEAKRKALAAKAAAEVQPPPASTPQTRLNVGAPVFVAARYDATHVVFMAGTDTQPRFSDSSYAHTSAARRVPPAAKPAAQLAALQELWEPDSPAPGLPETVRNTKKGDPWILQLSQASTLPLTIERSIVAATGCTLSVGFLAEVPPDQQAAFAASSQEYFVVRRSPVQLIDRALATDAVAELSAQKLAPDFEHKIVELLTARMKQELPEVEARLLADAVRPNGDSWVAATTRSRLERWKQLDEELVGGAGRLEYDIRAFRLAPDGVPRLFVRGRWRIAGETMFLMTAWFRADAAPVLLSADSSWSQTLREGEVPDSSWDHLNFQKILNVFDADRDGWAELLVYSNDGTSAEIGLYLYTDLGLVPLKTSFRRDIRPAESCLDGQ